MGDPSGLGAASQGGAKCSHQSFPDTLPRLHGLWHALHPTSSKCTGFLEHQQTSPSLRPEPTGAALNFKLYPHCLCAAHLVLTVLSQLPLLRASVFPIRGESSFIHSTRICSKYLYNSVRFPTHLINRAVNKTDKKKKILLSWHLNPNTSN